MKRSYDADLTRSPCGLLNLPSSSSALSLYDGHTVTNHRLPMPQYIPTRNQTAIESVRRDETNFLVRSLRALASAAPVPSVVVSTVTAPVVVYHDRPLVRSRLTPAPPPMIQPINAAANANARRRNVIPQRTRRPPLKSARQLQRQYQQTNTPTTATTTAAATVAASSNDTQTHKRARSDVDVSSGAVANDKENVDENAT